MRTSWPLITLLGLASIAISVTRADDLPARFEVIAPKDDGLNATGINARGDIVGFEPMERPERPGIVDEAPFFLARGKSVTYLPLLKGYTATFPAALSDDGLVVGRASKPGSRNVRVMLRNQAFVWDAGQGIRGLGALEGDWSSLATGVSRDGRRVSGFSVGDNRIRACVWDRDGETWKGTAMAHEGRLSSTTVPISDDGKRVAGVDGVVPCLWTLGDSGTWSREVIGGGGELMPRGVNNAGVVVGVRFAPGGTHAAVWTREKGIRLVPEPKGYVRSEAMAVNNLGVVVGMVDGPAGSKTGPNAFAYGLESGKYRVLDEGGPNFAGANAVNDLLQVTGVMEKKEVE
jgi:uncharacterized membrane protein